MRAQACVILPLCGIRHWPLIAVEVRAKEIVVVVIDNQRPAILMRGIGGLDARLACNGRYRDR
jgi:hypothetical protein